MNCFGPGCLVTRQLAPLYDPRLHRPMPQPRSGSFSRPQGDFLLLRPLTRATDQVVALHEGLTDLLGYSFPEERVRSAKFPPPTPNDLSNFAGAHLLWQAARLTLREGATPLCSLGRVSIRPRTYQFVPLPMAPRLDTVRMLIADDVAGYSPVS